MVNRFLRFTSLGVGLHCRSATVRLPIAVLGRKKAMLTVNSSGCAAFGIRQARFRDRSDNQLGAAADGLERPQRPRIGAQRAIGRCSCRGQPEAGRGSRTIGGSPIEQPSVTVVSPEPAVALARCRTRHGPRSCFDRATSKSPIAVRAGLRRSSTSLPAISLARLRTRSVHSPTVCLAPGRAAWLRPHGDASRPRASRPP
jgi:hypothetical protein